MLSLSTSKMVLSLDLRFEICACVECGSFVSFGRVLLSAEFSATSRYRFCLKCSEAGERYSSIFFDSFDDQVQCGINHFCSFTVGYTSEFSDLFDEVIVVHTRTAFYTNRCSPCRLVYY